MNAAQKALLEPRGRHGHDVGRDPRRVSHDELIAAGHEMMSPLKALRRRCLDCCADQPREVRLCTAVTCASWPFRMGTNPWLSEAQMEARRQALKKAAAAKNAPNGGGLNSNWDPAATGLPAALMSEKSRPKEQAETTDEKETSR